MQYYHASSGFSRPDAALRRERSIRPGETTARRVVQYNSSVQTDCLYNECIRKRCSFQRKIFACEVASFGLFQNRLLDSARLALKRNSCLVAEKGIFSGAIWFL